VKVARILVAVTVIMGIVVVLIVAVIALVSKTIPHWRVDVHIFYLFTTPNHCGEGEG
jgi:DMSO reductase anchor subunit